MSDEQIPGFSAEQSWVIRTVARESARQAIVELSGKPCPFACEEVAVLKATTYGNGTSGLKSRVTTLEEQVGNLVWWMRATIVASLGAVGAVIVSLAK